MRVLKVVAEGLTTSFRYPHFMQQIHPSYQMPPPATIYGHICSALGEWFDPKGVKVSYHFTHHGYFKDIEHIIVLSPTKGKLPGTKMPKVLEGKVNPFEREIFFQPRLTLYLNQLAWEQAFRSPRYAVTLGRSQDLFTYTHVGVIELKQAYCAYFEHTLVPHKWTLQTMSGVTVLMPRYLDYGRGRTPVFTKYVALKERVHLPREDTVRLSNLSYGPFWVDPTTPEVKGEYMGLAFLSFIGDDDDRLSLA
ncbi:MAG: CRISPR-associated protein Cas5 [Deltaproteobacteria bacterium]|nr:CRISPR-associated protein Cas5 [Deltaproteobacteria bacterium]